jgi:hypothetical protein
LLLKHACLSVFSQYRSALFMLKRERTRERAPTNKSRERNDDEENKWLEEENVK